VLGAAVTLLRRCTPSLDLNDFPLELGLHYLVIDDCSDTDECWEAVKEVLEAVTHAQAILRPQNRPSCFKDVNAANFQKPPRCRSKKRTPRLPHCLQCATIEVCDKIQSAPGHAGVLPP
jgi:hypothetical protein